MKIKFGGYLWRDKLILIKQMDTPAAGRWVEVSSRGIAFGCMFAYAQSLKA
jgi:hypothetical protein